MCSWRCDIDIDDELAGTLQAESGGDKEETDEVGESEELELEAEEEVDDD